MKTDNKPKSLFSMQIENNSEAHELMIGLNMVGINVSIRGAELILQMLKAKEKMKGKFDLKTAVKIQVEVNEKHDLIELKFNTQSK